MKIILAGYNIDSEHIERAQSGSGAELTPESISAAYARISRDPRNVDVLRREAVKQVEKARRSNETIVFGLGHSSVAEHAVFNFDVMRISRLAVEAVEHFRLASFTEKSQRYIRLGRDHVLPKEIRELGLEKEFKALVSESTEIYRELYTRIEKAGFDKWTAREDARYLMPLATSAQFGMTVNARELEYMISRLSSHPLDEVRRFASSLSRIARKKAPSLVKYPEPTEYFLGIHRAKEEIRSEYAERTGGREEPVTLIDHTPEGDRKLAAAIIFSGGGISYTGAVSRAGRMPDGKRKELIKRTFASIKMHDSVWREFENIHMLFEVVVSASCYAQLKRHRMSTQTVQPYSTALGVSIPRSVLEARGKGIFSRAVKRSESLYRRIARGSPQAAEYVLTNAHRRRVLIGMNLRELHHFSRLRSDIHAQWEIRRISERMCSEAARKLPAGTVLLCGKNSFEEVRKRAGV